MVVEVKLNCSFEVAKGTLRAILGDFDSDRYPLRSPVVGTEARTSTSVLGRVYARFSISGLRHGDFGGAVAGHSKQNPSRVSCTG